MNDLEMITKLKKDNTEIYKDEPHSVGHIFEIWKFHQS